MIECFILIPLVFCYSGSFTDAVTITSAGLHRKILGESCKLQWTVTGTFTNYTIESLASGSPVPLTYDYRISTTFDQNKGVIELQIWNIQLTDGADYRLHLRTGSLPDVYANGTLFFYAPPSWSQVILVSGPNPGKVGDNFEVKCGYASTSQPAKYRPKAYYTWGLYSTLFQNISYGTAITTIGEVMSRFTIKNDGQNLAITSAQGCDNHIGCLLQEEGSPYKAAIYTPAAFEMQGAPMATVFKPPNRKLTVSSFSERIIFAWFYQQYPITSYTNWSFVSLNGSMSEFPVSNDLMKDYYVYIQVTVPVNSTDSYGDYSITATNTYGSTTETLQVLPPGPPDAPSLFSVQYVTHNIVSLQWHCMWFNGIAQTVFVLLIEVASNTVIDTLASAPDNDCYNLLNATVFRQNIQPETQYKAIIWSSNQFGSSDEQSLNVTTQKRPTLDVTCDDISLTDSQAVIIVTTSCPDVVWLNVTGCVELTAACVVQSYTLLTPVNQITVNNLPTGDNYVFDFTLFNGDFYNYVYVLVVLKGIGASRISPCTSGGGSLSVTTIALIVLLGVVVLASIGILAGFLIWKHYQRKRQYMRRQLPTLPEPIQDISDENYDTINPYPETHANREDPYSYETINHRDVETAGINGFNEQTENGIQEMGWPLDFEDDHPLLLA